MSSKKLNESEISEKEIHITLSSTPEDKIDYFLKKSLANHHVISIRNDKSVLSFYDDQGKPCIPFWTHTDFTKPVIDRGWNDCYPTAIDLHSFQHHWLPGMEKDGVQIALFVHPDHEMTLLNASEMIHRLTPLHDHTCCNKGPKH